MIWLYRLLYVPALLLLAPHYLWRMRKRGGYRGSWRERFGWLPPVPPKRPGVRRVWLQAVSVGEVLAIGPLLEAWRQAGDTEVWLSTTTSTGHQLARERHGGHVLGLSWFPLDAWPCAARAWRRIEPDLVVLMEGERWPEHLHQARRRGVPVVCINARMSDRSFRRLQRLRALVPMLFEGVTRLLAASEPDAERFRALGIAADRMVVTGNLKLDVTITPIDDARRLGLRRELGLGDSPVILGSSTWPGEEAALLAALPGLRARWPDVRLLLVPRHAERRGEIEGLLAGGPWRWHFRSRGVAPGDTDVAVADTTGELRALTQLADVVFVGKSLPPNVGGQTPVEAAALARPLLFGPDMSNFPGIAQELVSTGAARVVFSAAELEPALAGLLADPAARAAMSRAGRAWHRHNQGAAARTLAELASLTRSADSRDLQ